MYQIRSRPRRKQIALIALIIAVVLPTMASAASAGTPQLPDEVDPSSSDVLISKQPMNVGCDAQMTDRARQYAVEQGYCPEEAVDARPTNTVPGTCGTSFLFVFDESNGGDGTIRYGFNSSLGPIVSRNLSIGFAGVDNLGSFGDASLMFSSSYESARTVFFGAGGLGYAQMGGTATTSFGLPCTINLPADVTFISF